MVVNGSRLTFLMLALPPPSYFALAVSSTVPAVENDLMVYGPLTVFHSGSVA